jgi:hypothetical protein
VLVAIAIPVFTTQLEKSREATDVANVRSAYAALMADYIADGTAGSSTVTAQQQQDGWQGPGGTLTLQINGTESTKDIPAKTDSYTITIGTDGTPNIS